MHVEIQLTHLWIVVGSLLRATPLCCWFQGSVSRAFTLLSCSVVRGARLCSLVIARLSRWSKCLWNHLGELRRDKNCSRPLSSSSDWHICWLRAGTQQQRRPKAPSLHPGVVVEFGPCASAETVKACALTGLHMMAEEKALWLGSDFSTDQGDMWRNVCPESPEWISSGRTSEASCGLEFYEHNVENTAIEVIGEDRSSNVVALFLKGWELGRVALSCHMTMEHLCQEMRDAFLESSDR